MPSSTSDRRIARVAVLAAALLSWPEALRAQATNTYTAIAAGGYHTCAITSLGAAWCWGLNDKGQLGTTTTQVAPDGRTISSVPVEVSGGHRFLSLTAGDSHTCGVTTAFAVMCWGDNSRGQLASRVTNSLTPIQVVDARRPTLAFRSVAAGPNWTCAAPVDSIGRIAPVECWGDRSPNGSSSVRAVASTLPLRAVFGGRTDQVCATDTTSAVLSHASASQRNLYCWGQLTSGVASVTSSSTPVSVGRLVLGVSSGPKSLCGVTRASASSGSLFCLSVPMWRAPIPVPPPFTTIAGGGRNPTAEFFCASTTTGGVYCWGDGSSGTLGNPQTANNAAPAPALTGAHVVRAVATGAEHACGVTSGGLVLCWGKNNTGQLGTGNTTDANVPTLTK